jgi:hypothetical protein
MTAPSTKGMCRSSHYTNTVTKYKEMAFFFRARIKKIQDALADQPRLIKAHRDVSILLLDYFACLAFCCLICFSALPTLKLQVEKSNQRSEG